MGASLPAELESELTHAASGRMPLVELLDRAQALQQDGRGDAAANLYERWIAHSDSDSPLRAIALYNSGTVLAARKRYDEARRAYECALAMRPGSAQALWSAIIGLAALG